LPTLREAGLLDPDTIRLLESYKEHYEPNSEPHYENEGTAYWYYNTERYNRIVRRNVGENISKAVEAGNKSIVSHAVGLEKEGTAEMDFLDYEKLADLIEKPSLLFLLFGDTGSGKTFTGVRLSELWKYRVGGTVLTNVQSLAESVDELVYIDSYVDLLWYCIENPKERKLLLADELSSLMSGYGDDRADVERYMRPLERKKRKEPFRLSTIGIGHRVGDIHPTMRNGELAYFGIKMGEKEMTVYHDEDLDKEYCEVKGIGVPNWDVDTDDDGVWYWGSEDEILEAARAIDDAGYGDILRLIENLAEDEDEEEDDEWHDCLAETNAGEPCPNKAKFPEDDPVVCANHRSKMDDFLSE
jgi:hypothetical protein